jgi:hypothetical protein
MFKIWARTIKKDKIVNEYIYTRKQDFDENKFYEYLMDICKELDLETPIALKKHINNFVEFNSVKFIKEDFLDKINFDYFILENVS